MLDCGKLIISKWAFLFETIIFRPSNVHMPDQTVLLRHANETSVTAPKLTCYSETSSLQVKN